MNPNYIYTQGNHNHRRAGLSKRNYTGPRLLKIINASPAAVSSSATIKSVGRRTESRKIMEEDTHRKPDSSDSNSESDDGNHNMQKTAWGTIPQNANKLDQKQEKPDWMKKRDESQARTAKRVLKKVVNNSSGTNAAGKTNAGKSPSTPASSQSSNGSKRKGRGHEQESRTHGADMADALGQVKIKKPRVGYGKPKISSIQSPKNFTNPDPMSSSDAVGTPKKFNNPSFAMTPEKQDKGFGSSFKTYEGSPFSSSPTSALKSTRSQKEPFSPSPTKAKQEKDSGFKSFSFDSDDDDEEMSKIASQNSLPPSLTDTKPPAKTAPPATQKVFNNYDFDVGSSMTDDSVIVAANKILQGTGSFQLPISSGRASVMDNDEALVQQARCPMCNEPVDPQHLKDFGAMNTRMQETFCRAHRVRTAEDEWKYKDYPKIDWIRLDARISKHHAFIRKLINGQASHYRTVLSEKINAGQDRSLKSTTSNLIPGYYGARGLRIISENIMQKFTALLQKRMVKDRLMSARGFTPYLQSVLVPEVAVLLIKDDMDVSDEEARDILTNSAVIGELLNEEVREVVKKRIGDSEDEGADDDFDELIDD